MEQENVKYNKDAFYLLQSFSCSYILAFICYNINLLYYQNQNKLINLLPKSVTIECDTVYYKLMLNC